MLLKAQLLKTKHLKRTIKTIENHLKMMLVLVSIENNSLELMSKIRLSKFGYIFVIILSCVPVTIKTYVVLSTDPPIIIGAPA